MKYYCTFHYFISTFILTLDLYDFGDSWFHKVKLVEIDDYFHNGIVELLDGARACPPEDHGSIREYTKTLDILKDPKNKKV